jgi:hypothetical protein
MFFLYSITACGIEENSPSNLSNSTGSYVARLVFPDDITRIETKAEVLRGIDCDDYGISVIRFAFYNADDTPLVDDQFPCSNHHATVTGIPAGNNRRLVVTAEDQNGEVLLRGEERNITIRVNQNTKGGDIPMLPVDSPSGDNLRKEISFFVMDVSSDFSFGTAYATRPYLSTQYVYGIIPITNNSYSETHCFIQLEIISYKDSNDNLLYQKDLLYVTGQVQWDGGTIYTNTCLKPRERGHFVLIDNNDADNLYDNTSFIEVDAISVSTLGINWQDPPADVQEQSGGIYTATSSNVPVINNGTESARLNETSVYILTDSSGEPVIWSFFDSASASILAAGDTATYTASTSYENTGVQGGFSYINFSGIVSSSSPPLYHPTPWPLKSDYYIPEVYKKALNDTKNYREELKQNSLW